ncbi:MAG: CinA family nicotinamide mononucleotide deamidase-related protein [Bacteroidales bacterium]|jgi:nicotinamide-nucleotide amidase|nr:CinA family nicotinamide mononucleotide deamidase-related protein [Bacteroidales bacterium]
MKAVIITIGDEILIGQTVDTNAAWLGKMFNQRGITVEKTISIRDDEHAIHQALDESFKIANVVLMTGGLGPTADDITKESLCSYFNTELVLSEKSLQQIKGFVESRGYSVNENNYNQAMLPEACTVISNHIGTAPIMQFEQEGRLLFSMPGVPFEMKYAMEHEVFPRIEERFSFPPVFHQTVMTYGMPEAFLAEKLNDWANQLQDCVKLAYLPSPKGIKIRLSVYDTAISGWKEAVETAVIGLKEEIPELIFSEQEENLENALFHLLKQNNLKLSVAESCTGGLIGSLMTSIPGASEVFEGGVIAYSNNVKQHLLSVSEVVLEEFGAVSEETVREMASQVKNKLHTNCAIAVSGIAGPDGGSEAKPVGTVWIAVALGNQVVARKFQFGSIRWVNTEKAAYSAMHLLYKLIKKEVMNS